MGSDPTHHGSHFARVCRILQPRISRHCLRLPSVTVRKERSHLETQAPHTRPYSSIASGTDYAGHVFPAQTIHRTRGGVGLFINVPISLLVLITGIDYQRLTTNRRLPKRRRRSGSGTNYGCQHEFYFAFCVQVPLSLFWWLYHCVLLLMRFTSILSFCSLVFATPRTSCTYPSNNSSTVHCIAWTNQAGRHMFATRLFQALTAVHFPPFAHSYQ